jgi:peptidoglycan/LPS O-acetylase OafA/YrhL
MHRLPFMDFLRALASQLIVLHHLAFYGPLSDRAAPMAPALFGWLSEYARMAVQIFFVLGGFFAARTLSRAQNLDASSVARLLLNRYRRVGVPYAVTLIVAIGANALAAQWMSHDAISAPPQFDQLVAHALFLQDILGYPALTAGIWYLAIDFQLFLLFLAFVWIGQGLQRRCATSVRVDFMKATLLLLAPVALSSLCWFNRHAVYDIWAVYFMGAYFLGILLHEVLDGRLEWRWAALYLSITVAAALLDLRPRLLVAAGTALAIFVAARTGVLERWPRSRIVGYGGRISLSLFLIHFPVLLVVNAWASTRVTSAAGSAAMLLLAYGLSLAASSLLYHGIEKRFGQPALARPRPSSPPAWQVESSHMTAPETDARLRPSPASESSTAQS